MKRIKYFLLRKLANAIIWYLHRGGFAIVGPNDAAIIFRQGSTSHEAHFPRHLAPDDIEDGEEIEMPAYLAAALVSMFALSKPWVMHFLHHYLNNEAEVDGDMETHKQQMFARVQVEQATAQAGQPEIKTDQVLH